MAREMSDVISNKTTDVNAQLAQDIVGNNRWNSNQDLQRQQLGLSGMQSLYGATPGLAQLYGNQAINFEQLENQKRQQGLSQIAQLLSSLR
jgi:hypothetical protein